MTADPEIRHTVLYQRHVDLGARMVPFGGWSMPVQYSGISQEHAAVRERAGLFDVSHMGQFVISGSGARAFLDFLLPGDVSGLAVGKIIYCPLCNAEGGVIDDALLYCNGDCDFILVVNAARTAVDWSWISELSEGSAGITLEDRTPASGMLAVQGPDAEKVLTDIGIEALGEIGYYTAAPRDFGGADVIVSRSGYTGEDGFEIIATSSATADIWDRLVPAGARPCGLGARDTLRTEMGYCLYGHELDESVSPLEAGIGWTLQLNKATDFVGRAPLVQQKRVGLNRRLRGVRLLEKGIPRPGHSVEGVDGQTVGKLTSGTFSPTLKQGIGLAFIDQPYGRRGDPVFVDIRGKRCSAEIVRPPFVPSRVKKEG